MATSQDALARVPLFSGLPKRDLKRLADTLSERTFPAGTKITSEDKGGAGFFVIADGTATVRVRGAERRSLGPNDYFGEMALIDGDLRSAEIVADTDVRCYGLTSWNFKPFVEDHPEVAWCLLEALVRRVRAAEARAAEGAGASPGV
jgi:CRP/FNR family cyclic AMP-dependent transcriptional regulator